MGEREKRRAAAAREQEEKRRVKSPEEYDLWREGRLVPARITMFLNMHDLYGPEVDLACGAEEPAVDKWEAGEWYPTWEQACRLVDLLELPSLQALCMDPGPLAPMWVCGKRCDYVLPADQILSFRPAAVGEVVSKLW